MPSLVPLCTVNFLQVLEPLQDCEVDCDTVHEAVVREHAACLRHLLARDDRIMLTVNDKGATPLHLVNHKLSPFCCTALTAPLLASMPAAFVRTVVNTLDSQGIPAVHYTVDEQRDLPVCHSCLRALLAAGADPSISVRPPYNEPAIKVEDILHDAEVRRRSAGFKLDEWMITAKALQAAGLDFSVGEHLHEAAGEATQNGASFDSFTMKILLECGVNPLQDSSLLFGRTALHTAAIGLDPEFSDLDEEEQQQQQIEIIQLLYDYGGDELLQATTASIGETALHLAIFYGDTVEKLLELGAEVNAARQDGKTPLHLACEHSAGLSAMILLDCGADVHAYSKPLIFHEHEGGWQAIHFAAVHAGVYDGSIVQTLLDTDEVSLSDTTECGCMPVWLAARHSETAVAHVKQLVQLGAKLKCYSKKHGTLLHAAAGGGNTKLLQWLLQHGLSLSSKKSTYRTAAGATPLHCAAEGGHAAMIQLLLKKCCDFTVTDANDSSPLRSSLQGPDWTAAACFKLLLEVGSDVLHVTNGTR
jgi:ankyrin repeat protein